MGKLHALNRFLAGRGDDFSQVTGDVAALRRTRYVVVLDDDTAALPGAVRALAAAIHHPLNRPRVSSKRGDVEAGYGMMRCPILAREESLRTWRRPGMFLRSQPVLDASTSRLRFRNLPFDLCGQAAFVGKGIYDAALAHELLDDRLPLERVLSHDLVEGAFLRTGFVSDARLVDQFPDTYLAYCDRVHRWIRGDWQNLGFLLYPGRMWGANRHGKRIPAFLRFLILNNLRLSSYVVVYTALFCSALALDQDRAGVRVLATLFLALAPVQVRLLGQGIRPIQSSRIRPNELAICDEPRFDGKAKCATLALESAFVEVRASVA
jgi:hypothetical protein